LSTSGSSGIFRSERKDRDCAENGSYLGKYVAKTFATEDLRGLHRYEVAQGFQPPSLRLEGRSDVEILERASEHMGAEPTKRWYSNERKEWRGPPALWFQWATPL